MAVVKHWVQGDTVPITFAIKDEDGAAVSLVGYSGKFFMRRQGAAANKVNGTAITVTSAASGYCEYRWIAGDVDTAGSYDCEVELTDASSKLATTEPIQPFTLVIRKGLG